MKTPNFNAGLATGIVTTAYGVAIKDPSDFKDPFAFDDYDLWFGSDFNFFLDNLFDNILNDIASDITSVDSTNESEAESKQQSAQQSADQAAAGDDGVTSVDTGMSPSVTNTQVDDFKTVGTTTNTTTTINNSSDAGNTTGTLDHAHSDPHSGKHGHGTTESSRSGTLSHDQSGTSRSNSEGTSGTSVSTVSFTLVPYKNFFENANDDQKIEIMTVDDQNGTREFGTIGGLDWTGDADNEYIFGTMWLDELSGLDGDDIIYGLEANDYIRGGNGSDRLFGDGGNDRIFSGAGGDGIVSAKDFLSGGSGNDSLYGVVADPNDNGQIMFGGPGHDYLWGYAGNDDLYGDAGADYIRGGDDDDDIHGGNGDDKLFGNAGNDDVHGDAGDDTVRGGAGNDDLYGGEGDDVVHGDEGADELSGGAGDDQLFGGPETNGMNVGGDVIRGGAGDDLIKAGRQEDAGTAVVAEDADGNAWTGGSAYHYLYGDEGNDTIFGEDRTVKEKIWGGAGRDTLYGGDNVTNTFLYGNAGDDTIHPGDGAVGVQETSRVKGGEGDDVINPQELTSVDGANDTVSGTQILDAGNDMPDMSGKAIWSGGEGNDQIWSPADVRSDFYVFGDQGDDEIYPAFVPGTGNTSYFYGGGGEDEFHLDHWASEGADNDGNGGFDAGQRTYVIHGDAKYDDENRDIDLWGEDDTIFADFDATQDKALDINAFLGDGDDTMSVGNAFRNVVGFGGYGADSFDFGVNNQRINLYGQDGNDTVRGPSKADYLDYQTRSGNAGVAVRNPAVSAHLGRGNDSYYGGYNDDVVDVFGMQGDDRIVLNSETGNSGDLAVVSGGPGDDFISSGGAINYEYLYGDFWQSKDDVRNPNRDIDAGPPEVNNTEELHNLDFNDYGVASDMFANVGEPGDDVIIGGDNGIFQKIIGGPGSDQIWTGNKVNRALDDANIGAGDQVIYVFGDTAHDDDASDSSSSDDTDTDNDPLPADKDNNNAGDGDDMIDVGNENVKVFVYGDNGNDKIFGGVSGTGVMQVDNLFGGGGDDKIYANNPGEIERGVKAGAVSPNFLHGGDDNDWIYGSNAGDYIFGDNAPDDDSSMGDSDGDDKIYGYDGDDYIYGGGGDDQMFGGDGANYLDAGAGDDQVQGGEDVDKIFGRAGDDKLYGQEGNDEIEGGTGDDLIKGGDGDDTLNGGAGEDEIWGEAGADTIDAGLGWDTIFAGEGCDTVRTYDGGDVVWLGDCDAPGTQQLFIYGTGEDPENYTVIMDFWNEASVLTNQVCLHVDNQQAAPTAQTCAAGDNNDGICMTPANILDPNTNAALMGNPGEYRGGTCKNDGGPLWITITLQDDPIVQDVVQQIPILNDMGMPVLDMNGDPTFRTTPVDINYTVWARFYQKAATDDLFNFSIHDNRFFATGNQYQTYALGDSIGRQIAAPAAPRITTTPTTTTTRARTSYIPSYRSSAYSRRRRRFAQIEDSEAYNAVDSSNLTECLRVALCTTDIL